MTEALARLLQNGKGAAARLSAKHKALMCDKSFPMMRRLFDAVVRPTVSYGCEVWAPACSLALVPQLKDMQDIQLSFFRNLCQLRKSVTPHIIFREFAERPWLDSWWSMVLGFMRRLSLLPEGSLHLDVLRDNIADARQPLMCANWAAGVDKQFRDLGMGSPFVSSGIGALDSLGFMSRSAKRREQVWESLHVSPRTAPSKGAKLCAYHHWFGRPSNLRFEPYYELPMGISKLRALVQFRLGSHTLPIEQGRFARPAVLRHLRRCTVAIHKLWAMSSIVCLIALISVTSGPNFLACSKMLRGACVCSCGTRTRSLSAIVSLPCCRRLRHEHSPVLISQAG